MIIVTGGAGFIGSNIVKELNNQGRTDILVIDDLDKGDKYKNLIGLHFIDYQHKDHFLENFTSNDFYGLNIDAIFHEGACSDTMEYNVNYMMQTNFEYSKALLRFCINRQIPFIYASSASTYGGGQNGFREADECESALNPYAFSKLLFDRYVRQFMADARSKIVGLRYFNVYGPQEAHKGKMASIEQKRDFIYVKDVVKVNLWCLENEIKSGIYNCGTGQAHTFNEAASAVINALGTGKIEYTDFPEELRGK